MAEGELLSSIRGGIDRSGDVQSLRIVRHSEGVAFSYLNPSTTLLHYTFLQLIDSVHVSLSLYLRPRISFEFHTSNVSVEIFGIERIRLR